MVASIDGLDAKTRRALTQLPTITPTLLAQLDAVPTGMRIPRVLAILNELAVDADHSAELATSFAVVSPARRATFLLRARAVAYRAGFWDLFHTCLAGAKMDALNSLPPLVLDPNFVPLTTHDELNIEGKRMQNCLGGLYQRHRHAQSKYFSWTGDPRATVELEPVDGRWVWACPGLVDSCYADSSSCPRCSYAAGLT